MLKLSPLMALTIMAMSPVKAWATVVTYRVPTYNTAGDPKSGIKSWSIQEVDATQVTASTQTMTAGWYYVTGKVSRAGMICSGEVHLILCDGASLTVQEGESTEAGIRVSGSGNSLTIYAQSEGDTMGALSATAGNKPPYYGGAGIGGAEQKSGSNITINGGKITAKGVNGGTGIGGGYLGNGSNIVINGGIVTAKGSSWINGNHGAGIGGGYQHSGTNIIINGGTVAANGGSRTDSNKVTTYAPGIGGGYPDKGIDHKTGIDVYINTDGWVKAGSSANPTSVIANEGGDLGSALSNKIYVVAHIHRYGEPSWVWADDGSNATLTFTCSDCDSPIILSKESIPAVSITPEVTTPATCTKVGTTTYNASVTYKENRYDAPAKTLADIPAKGHSFGADRICSSCGAYEPATQVTAQNAASLGLTPDYVGYYAIQRPTDLAWFRDFVNTGVRNDGTLSYPNTAVNAVLTTDIDMSTICHAAATGVELLSWVPIGVNYSGHYLGTFDGKGHEVTNFYIDNEHTMAGLFGYLGKEDVASDATVKNLTLRGSVKSSCNRIAGIVATSYGTISDCTNYASVEATSPYSYYIGGIAGCCSHSTGMAKIENCVNNGVIKSTSNQEEVYIAGIVGYAKNTAITDCSNNAKVESKGLYVGGIAGYVIAESSASNVAISRCSNTGSISAGGAYVGGLVGYIKSSLSGFSISNCYTTGNVNSTTMKTDAYIGGAFGLLDVSGAVTNIYSTATITKNAAATQYVGAFAGNNTSTLTDCYYDNQKTSLNFIGGGNTPSGYNAGKGTAIFTSGEMCYLLNDCSNTGNSLVWGQVLEAEATPTLCGGGVNSYKRTMTNQWGTIVVPFAIVYSQSNEHYKLYHLISVSAASLTFAEYADDDAIAAGTPMTIKAVGEKDDETDTYEVTLTAHDNDVDFTINPTSDVDGLTMHGTYQNIASKASNFTNGVLYMAQNSFWSAESATIPPFRAWFEGTLPVGSGAKAHCIVVADETDGISEIRGERSEAIDGTLGNGRNVFLENGKIVIVTNGQRYNASGQVLK